MTICINNKPVILRDFSKKNLEPAWMVMSRGPFMLLTVF